MLKTYHFLGIKFDTSYEILSLLIDSIQLKLYQLDIPQLYFCSTEAGVQEKMKEMRQVDAMYHLKLTYIFGFYYLKTNAEELKLKLDKVYQKLNDKKIKLIDQKKIPLLMVKPNKDYELTTSKGLFNFKNITGKDCNEILLLNTTEKLRPGLTRSARRPPEGQTSPTSTDSRDLRPGQLRHNKNYQGFRMS